MNTHRTIFSIYWAARVRHFEGDLARLAGQLGKQVSGFCISKTWRVLKHSSSALKLGTAEKKKILQDTTEAPR